MRIDPDKIFIGNINSGDKDDPNRYFLAFRERGNLFFLSGDFRELDDQLKWKLSYAKQLARQGYSVAEIQDKLVLDDPGIW